MASKVLTAGRFKDDLVLAIRSSILREDPRPWLRAGILLDPLLYEMWEEGIPKTGAWLGCLCLARLFMVRCVPPRRWDVLHCNWVMGRHSTPRTLVFEMTHIDKQIVELKRAGKTNFEIADALGIGNYDLRLISAIEKDRLRILAEQDSTRPGAATTLAKARRPLRPIGDVRKGKWKSNS